MEDFRQLRSFQLYGIQPLLVQHSHNGPAGSACVDSDFTCVTVTTMVIGSLRLLCLGHLVAGSSELQSLCKLSCSLVLPQSYGAFLIGCQLVIVGISPVIHWSIIDSRSSIYYYLFGRLLDQYTNGFDWLGIKHIHL